LVALLRPAGTASEVICALSYERQALRSP